MEEIFDAFDKISEISNLRWEINQLERDVNHSMSTCGSCEYWITSNCPREKTRKVTCNDLIRSCEKFKMKKWSEDFINSKKAKLVELNEKLNALLK